MSSTSCTASTSRSIDLTPCGERLALLLGHGLDQPSPEGPKPVLPGLVELVGHGDVPLVGRELLCLGLEVEPREEVVEVEGTDLNRHS
jgi:hypothetical protein